MLSRAEVGFNDLGVGLYLRRCALCNLFAIVQYCHRIAQAHDQFDIVLDQQNGASVMTYAVYQFTQLHFLRGIHARRRFI